MIQRKKKLCKGSCNSLQYIFSNGLCQACASKTFKPIQKSKIKVKPPKPKENKDELNKFFDEHIQILSKTRCSYESGKYIHNPSRLNIAHLLPKRNHKSIAVCNFNVVYLTWQEHNTFDTYLDSHKFSEIEKTFPKTWILLKNVLSLVVERTKLVVALENYIENE